MSKETYYKIDIDNRQVRASYNSEDEKCVLVYHMSKAIDHPLASIYNKEITFRKADISLLISTLQELQESIDD